MITDYNNLYYFMSIKEFNAKRIHSIKKLITSDFIIKYCKKKLNFANALLGKSDIIKLNDSENNNDNFLFILQYKFCNSKYQSK